MNPDKAHKSDLSRVIILDIILIVAFASCILITTLMYDNESEKAAQKYINSNASSLEHNLEILDFENWDLIIRDFIDYYNMDVIVTDPNGDITYIFARGAIDSENSIFKTLEIGSTGYTLTVSAIPSDVTIIDNNTVSGGSISLTPGKHEFEIHMTPASGGDTLFMKVAYPSSVTTSIRNVFTLPKTVMLSLG